MNTILPVYLLEPISYRGGYIEAELDKAIHKKCMKNISIYKNYPEYCMLSSLYHYRVMLCDNNASGRIPIIYRFYIYLKDKTDDNCKKLRTILCKNREKFPGLYFYLINIINFIECKSFLNELDSATGCNIAITKLFVCLFLIDNDYSWRIIKYINKFKLNDFKKYLLNLFNNRYEAASRYTPKKDYNFITEIYMYATQTGKIREKLLNYEKLLMVTSDSIIIRELQINIKYIKPDIALIILLMKRNKYKCSNFNSKYIVVKILRYMIQ